MTIEAPTLTRRQALRLTGSGLAGLAFSGWARPGFGQVPGRIDIHHHWHPPPIADAFGGLSIGASWPGGGWTVERALSLMDRFGIQTGILSVRNPRERISAQKCREVNELAARIVGDSPERFGAFAMLPQFNPDRAAEEAAYALDSLDLDGVALNASADNVYLGAPALDPLMAVLDEREVVVLIHPTSPPYFGSLNLDIRPSVMEYVFETTRAIMNLVASGSLERYPNIRFITAHAGGAAPYIASRLRDQGERFIPNLRERAPQGVLSYLKGLYYGTAQAMSSSSLRALLDFVDVSQVVFGTDLPISPPSLVNDSDDVMQGFAGLSNDDLERIERGNALQLFPRLLA